MKILIKHNFMGDKLYKFGDIVSIDEKWPNHNSLKNIGWIEEIMEEGKEEEFVASVSPPPLSAVQLRKQRKDARK